MRAGGNAIPIIKSFLLLFFKKDASCPYLAMEGPLADNDRIDLLGLGD